MVGTDIVKTKVVDVESTEKPVEKKKLSFADKLQIFLNKLNKVVKNFQKGQIERSNKNIERLVRVEKETRLEAKIAKNKAAKKKVQGGKNQSNNDIDWLKFN